MRVSRTGWLVVVASLGVACTSTTPLSDVTLVIRDRRERPVPDAEVVVAGERLSVDSSARVQISLEDGPVLARVESERFLYVAPSGNTNFLGQGFWNAESAFSWSGNALSSMAPWYAISWSSFRPSGIGSA